MYNKLWLKKRYKKLSRYIIWNLIDEIREFSNNLNDKTEEAFVKRGLSAS